MSTNRSAARLPLEVFSGLLSTHYPLEEDGEEAEETKAVEETTTPEELRMGIATKLTATLGVAATAASVVCHDPIDLVNDLDPLLTLNECLELQRRVSQFCAPPSTTALDLWKQPLLYIATGLPSLDQHLRGGICHGTVTEVVGPQAAAKTQLALQLTRASPSSILIDTEQKMSLKRWEEIATGRSLDNTKLHSPKNFQELEDLFQSNIEEDILNRNVQLLILDSIAAPTRRAFASRSAAAQATSVLQLAQTLKRLAHQHQLAVVVVNQVAAGIEQPSLGTAWYHCVSTRLRLERITTDALDKRLITVTKSHMVGPSRPFHFQVKFEGLVEQQEEVEFFNQTNRPDNDET